MKKSITAFLILALIFSSTVAFADVIKAEDFRIEFTPPEGWFSSAAYSMSEQEKKLGIPEGSLKMRSELLGTTWLYYPVDGAYSLDAAIQITVSPMESYHQDYSGFGETQLGNVAQSFMKDGKVESYEKMKTASGYNFLRLNYAEGANAQYACFYITNENGATLRAYIPEKVVTDPDVEQWLESIVISESHNAVLELLVEYWYYIVIAIATVIGFRMKNKKAEANS